MTDDNRLQLLHDQSYAVFPGFLDRATTVRIRELVDRLLPPPATASEPKGYTPSTGLRSCPTRRRPRSLTSPRDSLALPLRPHRLTWASLLARVFALRVEGACVAPTGQ
jgi:hypothetical protein